MVTSIIAPPESPELQKLPPTILVVDDERGIREAYQQFLAPAARARVASHRLARHSISPDRAPIARLLLASSGEEAVQIVEREIAAGRRIQAGFFDMKMPGGIDGVETIRRVLALDGDLMCVVVTAHSDQPLEEIRSLFGPQRKDDWDYISKPFNENVVTQKARNAVASWYRRRVDAAEATALEEKVAERTQRLIESNAELERNHATMQKLLGELREANARLGVEMAERARLEENRRLASKLEGIGQLAAGIAHEINTPTQYILTSAELLEIVLADLLPEARNAADVAAKCSSNAEERHRANQLGDALPSLGTELESAVASVLQGARSIADIVGAMREFARVDPPDMCPADLNRAVMSTLEVVRYEYRQVAEIDLSLQPLPTVACHVGEIQQVLTNLIVNASHAIRRRANAGEGGKITISSRHDRARDRVIISVADNGSGIAPEHRERVFEPFFTTKPVGQGTGQGLSISRSVIARHHGTLEFESTVGVGTVFTMILPVHVAVDVDETAVEVS